MNDVHELMCEDQAQPVIHVADAAVRRQRPLPEVHEIVQHVHAPLSL